MCTSCSLSSDESSTGSRRQSHRGPQRPDVWMDNWAYTQHLLLKRMQTPLRTTDEIQVIYRIPLRISMLSIPCNTSPHHVQNPECLAPRSLSAFFFCNLCELIIHAVCIQEQLPTLLIMFIFITWMRITYSSISMQMLTLCSNNTSNRKLPNYTM